MSDFSKAKPVAVLGLFIVIIAVAIKYRPGSGSGNSADAYERSPYREDSTVAGSAPASPPSDRLKEVGQLRYKDAAAALAKLEAIIAKPESAKERAASTEMLPDILELNFYNFQKAKDEDGARVIFARLQKDHPEARAALAVRLAWGRTLIETLRAAIKEDDPAKVEAVFQEYLATGHYLPRTNAQGNSFSGDGTGLQEYAQYQLKRWRQLPPAERTAESGAAILALALSPVQSGNGAINRQRELRQEPPVYGAEFYQLAQTFEQQGLTAQAMNAWQFAQYLLNASLWNEQETSDRKNRMPYQERNEKEARFAGHVVKLTKQLASKIQAEPGSVLCTEQPVSLLNSVMNLNLNVEQRQELLDLRLKFAIEDYLAGTKPLLDYNFLTVAEDKLTYKEKTELGRLLHSARITAMRIREDYARQAFNNLTYNTNANIWADIPPQFVAEIESSLPPNTRFDRLETTRREKLRRMIGEKRLEPPVDFGPEFKPRWLQFTALEGIYLLGSNRDEAFRHLRLALYGGADAGLKTGILQSLQKALIKSRKEDKFDVLIELAGFYTAEYGDGLARDPFRDEFRQALESSTGKFKSGERMKRVFVQALLASAFPHEPVGIKAQTEVIKQGFEVVSGVTPEKNFNQVKLPSRLPGYSTVSVDNSTDFHILLVYDGPESFAVLCSPLHKGSFTLKNGTYQIAVMTPMGSIIPYRAERTLTDEHATSNYRVETSGSKPANNTFGGSRAYGDYTLLRTSGDLADAQVNPKDGTISR